MAALTKHPRLVLLAILVRKIDLMDFVALCMAGEGLSAPEANRKRLGEAGAATLLPVRVILPATTQPGCRQIRGFGSASDELKVHA